MNLQPKLISKINVLAGEINPNKIRVRPVTVRTPKVRTFVIPNDYAKEAQRALWGLLSEVQLSSYVFSQRGSSYIDKARYHLGDDYLINLDIKNFFPTIHYGRIEKLFREAGARKDLVKALVFLVTYDHHLPLGFSTSPILSNLVVADMDTSLNRYATIKKIKYSRYVDDVTLSSKNEITSKVESRFVKIIRGSGFKINDKKTSRYGPSDKKFVLGLALEDHTVNVTEEYISKVIGHLKTIKVGLNHKLDQWDLISSVKGELNFIKDVNEERYEMLVGQYPLTGIIGTSGCG